MITGQNTKTIYDLVKNTGDEFKDHVFLRYEENDVVYDVTYKQFAADCMAIAAWMAEKSRQAGRRLHVGLMGSSSHHYLAALLGIMSAGCVSVPLDIQVNLDTFCDCLTRSDVDILFYDWEHRSLVDGAKERCPRITDYISLQHGRHVPCSDNILKQYAGQEITPHIDTRELAMILFTSGTTGQGKGVMLSQGNLIDNVFCTTEAGIDGNQVFLNVLPIHHVFCINSDVFLTMRYGNILCLNRDMSKLVEHMRLFEPTRFRTVPMIPKSLYNRIMVISRQQPDRSLDDIKKEILGGRLTQIICGGGYLAPELKASFAKLDIEMAQGYGMSECSPKITTAVWGRPDKAASVGQLVDGCQVRIVDGEIQVKSPSVMMGYYKDPEQTAEVLTEDGWLCTGDCGYVDEENFLYLTGRKKNLIILSNGENVAPEQLEHMFDGDRLVEEILVFEENDVITAEIYPNYKYAQAAGITDIEGILSDLVNKHNQELPSFKRIMRFRVRETPFEKTSSKKIIRSKYFSKKKAEKEHLANLRLPENDLQTQIYNSVASCLGHRRFGIDTNLYEAGLDSMGSVLLLSDLAAGLNFSITLDELMSHPTVEQLEACYKETQARPQVDYSVRPVYPLTNLQIYFAYVMRGNTTANLPFFFKLDRSVNLSRLQRAAEDLFDLHPGLKAVIQMDEGAYKMFRHDDTHVVIPIIRVSDRDWEILRGQLLKPFMYEKDEPLYHVAIYETESANYLYFDIAHIVGDGMTMNVLFEDLNALYRGDKVEKESYTLFEYVLDEKDRDTRGLRNQNILYFRNLMKDFRIRRSILNRRDFHDLDHGENASLRSRFSRLNLKKITAFCREHGVSENVLFLTAYNYCIGIFSGEKDTISTSIHSGRTDGRWARLAGPLFLTYIFRCTQVPHETVDHLLKKNGQQIMDTMRCYVSTLHADEMFFQYQGDILNVDEIGGAPAVRQKMQLDSLPFHLQVMSDAKGYYYELRYWKNRFDSRQLEIFMDCMERIVEAMLDEPSVRRLKSHLPDTLFPKHYFIKAETVNRTVGYRLISDVDGDTPVKAYVMDAACRKQPFGGWGSLYIMDHPTEGWIDKVTNPYGPGTLYQTGITARILPDGTLDLLDQGGRTVMVERLNGRDFVDLAKLERLLASREDVDRAEAYFLWGPEHRLILCADVYGPKAPDEKAIAAFLEESWDADMPKVAEVHCYEENAEEK